MVYHHHSVSAVCFQDMEDDPDHSEIEYKMLIAGAAQTHSLMRKIWSDMQMIIQAMQDAQINHVKLCWKLSRIFCYIVMLTQN